MDFLSKDIMARLPQIIDHLRELPLDQIAEISKKAGGHYQMTILSQASSSDFSSCVTLKVVPSSREFGIIHVLAEHRTFFPGYRKQFILETDIKNFVMHLTGGNTDHLKQGTSLDQAVGEAIGQYLCHPSPCDVDVKLLKRVPDADSVRDGSFKRFYDKHHEIKPDDLLVICRRVAPTDQYVLTRIIHSIPVSQPPPP